MGGERKDDSNDEEEDQSISAGNNTPPLFEVKAHGNSGNKHAARSVADSPARNTRKQSSTVVADTGRAIRKRGWSHIRNGSI